MAVVLAGQKRRELERFDVPFELGQLLGAPRPRRLVVLFLGGQLKKDFQILVPAEDLSHVRPFA